MNEFLYSPREIARLTECSEQARELLEYINGDYKPLIIVARDTQFSESEVREIVAEPFSGLLIDEDDFLYQDW